jgi:hypothetical protein
LLSIPNFWSTLIFSISRVVSVADPGCLSRIRIFSIPDPNLVNSGPGSSSKNLSKTQKIISKLSEYDPGCSSRIRILIFYPYRIQGSKRHRIPYTGYGSATLHVGVENPEFEAGRNRVAEPYSFDMDPDPDPAFYADPDPIRIRIQGF